MRIKEILEAVAQGTIPPQAQRKVPQGTGAVPDEFGARTMGKGEEVTDIGTRTVYNKDGTSVNTSAQGQVTRDKLGRITQTQTPRIAGLQQTDKYDPGSIGNKPTSQSTNLQTSINRLNLDQTVPGPIGKADLSNQDNISLNYGDKSKDHEGFTVSKKNGKPGSLTYGAGPFRMDFKKDGNVDVLHKKTGKTIKTSLDAMSTGKDGI